MEELRQQGRVQHIRGLVREQKINEKTKFPNDKKYYIYSNLRVVAASMYVKRHFSIEAKEATVEMIEYIKRAFGKILDTLVRT